MSTGTALVNARTPTLKPEDQKGHGSVTYLSPEEQHAQRMSAIALGPDHELDCQLPPKNQQPGAKRRIVAKPTALAAPFGDPAAQAIAILIHNLDSGYAFLRHLDVTTKEAMLSALADDLGLAIE
ncbi:hypothetical protein HOS18_gp40 [Aeromonas phage CF7]|uniref:Uncharacterized protein n=1 Tax=Aeromonas phage CF7 TaxID=2507411 RepID=A0A249XLM0_9CAUD|nr:hypothetical protein HOS18_gp40 [Aeromonas phage CF7]ASZ71986.1 hypothetical protein CF7_40 [Aeromonas phage CF7]